MKISNSRWQTIKVFLGSSVFFRIIVGLFVFQAVWLACSALYPMAFDEDFHLGLIQLYAHHLSPFWSGHPTGGDAFGALTRDPSYLYQYLMSFIYRPLTWFTGDQTSQVMVLRFINIGLAAAGLIIYRKLLLKTKASSLFVNLSLLVFVLVPIFPYLAAQINYDNLLLPLIAWSLLLTIKLRESFQKKALDTRTLLVLVAVCLAASLVKYAFLPIFAAITFYLLICAYRVYGRPKPLLRAISAGAKQISRPAFVALCALVLLTGALFVERYGVNLIKYHEPLVDCGTVLDFDHCKSYGPWIRDYYLEQNKGDAQLSVVAFNNEWFQGMWFRSFFAISGATNSFQNSGPLTWPAVGTIIFAVIGLMAFACKPKVLFRKFDGRVMWLLIVSSLVYVAALWLLNYQMYRQTAVAVAINGRYLLPVIPIAVLLTALAVNEALRARTWLKLVFGTAVMICYIWGGGALTWILRSHDNWYWPNGPLNGANRLIQRDVGPYIPGYRHPKQYMP